MFNGSPKPLRPETNGGLFQLDEEVKVVRKSMTPMERQRAADGTPITRGNRTALRPADPALTLSDVHEVPLVKSQGSEIYINLNAIVKSWLSGDLHKSENEDYISRKIKKLRDEGYPEKQAVAIAYSYARRKKE